MIFWLHICIERVLERQLLSTGNLFISYNDLLRFLWIFSELFKLIQFSSQLLLQCMTVWVDCPNYESHCLCEILHLPKLWFKLIALYSSLVWNRLSVCKICFYFYFYINIIFWKSNAHLSVLLHIHLFFVEYSLLLCKIFKIKFSICPIHPHVSSKFATYLLDFFSMKCVMKLELWPRFFSSQMVLVSLKKTFLIEFLVHFSVFYHRKLFRPLSAFNVQRNDV